MDPAFRGLKNALLLATGHIPQAHRPISAGAGQGLAIGTETRCFNTSPVSHQGEPLLAGPEIPEFQFGFSFERAPTRGQGCSIRTEGNGPNPVAMSFEYLAGAFFFGGVADDDSTQGEGNGEHRYYA
jgi:hypothetical protein